MKYLENTEEKNKQKTSTKKTPQLLFHLQYKKATFLTESCTSNIIGEAFTAVCQKTKHPITVLIHSTY